MVGEHPAEARIGQQLGALVGGNRRRMGIVDELKDWVLDIALSDACLTSPYFSKRHLW